MGEHRRHAPLSANDLAEIEAISQWLAKERHSDDAIADIPADDLERFLWVAWGYMDWKRSRPDESPAP